MHSGPLNGLKIIEFEGIGPAPLAGQLLSDLGADVIKILRKHTKIKKNRTLLRHGAIPGRLQRRVPQITGECSPREKHS